ncbi:hypothetical protein BJV78DRAFT_849534 [Lactifluus subvellereus]|nr:hypothetical protein BJV78DRAFT_849534 [Lactifluus subvellereus]
MRLVVSDNTIDLFKIRLIKRVNSDSSGISNVEWTAEKTRGGVIVGNIMSRVRTRSAVDPGILAAGYHNLLDPLEAPITCANVCSGCCAVLYKTFVPVAQRRQKITWILEVSFQCITRGNIIMGPGEHVHEDRTAISTLETIGGLLCHPEVPPPAALRYNMMATLIVPLVLTDPTIPLQ